uniref:Golgi-specific brefeldin A-resistance guanine nucleotide exchange factor 1 n=1 Tax=Gasterosteus aculeatus aculeatus TaxID=481459 RepID=A0AAQ4Q5Y7_GASAC
MVDKNIYIVQGEIGTVVGAIKRNSRWNTHTPLDEEQDPLLNSFGHLKEILNNIKVLCDVEPNVFLRPFLEVVRSEDTTGPITGLALTSVNKFLCYGLIDANHEAAAEAIENMADAVTHARFVGTDPASDEVVLMKILQVLRTLLLTPVGAHLTNESVCEIMQSCFRICFEMRLSELLRKSAEHTLVDMVQLLFSSEFGEALLTDPPCFLQLKMRAGGMSESSKWKKQKRSPRTPCHMVRSPSGQMDSTQSSPLSSNNLSGSKPTLSFQKFHSSLSFSFKSRGGSEESQVEHSQSASVESIPEVLEDKGSVTEQSDSPSIHDMDYVNPRGVRFTQSTQRDGASIIPYGLPCLRELFRFLISLTNPHDRHNTDAMMHMGLQLLTVALESAHITNYQSLLGLVKDELCRHLFQNAFPVSGQLYTTHLLSLEALLTVIDSTEAHCQLKVLNSTAQQDQSETLLEEGDASTINGTDTMSLLPAENASVYGSLNVPFFYSAEKRPPKKPQRFSSCLPNSQELLDIRTKKRLLITGTEQFNQKPKKGIQFLQENGLLSTPLDNNQVAQWLRENPRLDKKMIGEYVSDRKNMELLDSFVNTFTFQGLRIDEALRLYLEAFRLPGEAPVIQRLLETFTDNWHKVNGSPFVTNDAGFALAYAVIMLNTDQHNHNVRKQNIPMTIEQFKKNLKGVNGNKDFDQDMLEDLYNAIKNEEIVMPDEQSGLVKENYVWSVLLHRGATPEGVFLHLPPGSYDHDLFTMTWGPTIAALSYVFDKSLDENIIQKAITGFRKCAMIAAHYGFSDVFDNLIISLCKFTTLSSESVENLPTVFGSNNKAQTAAKTVFDLAHRHGDILREGWKNIMDSMLQLFRSKLLPKAMVEVEDFVEPSGKISLQREETPSNRGESAVLSFVNWFTLSGAEQSGLRGPSTENQEAKQAAILCIKQCDPEKLITESKFLQLESLQELMKALISVAPDEDTYDEEDAAFCLEMLLRVTLENRDRVSCVWQTVRDHLCHLCVYPNESCFLVERAVVGLFRLAIRLLRREDISSEVLLSLRLLLMMKPPVLSRVSRQVAFGLHELLKTNAANIHSTNDWFTLFSLLECIGAGVKPPASFQLSSPPNDNDTGAQSDSELPSHHVSEVSLDRGYTSDSEIYTEHHSKTRIPRSTTDGDVATSGWLVVGKDDVEMSKTTQANSKALLNHPLVNQYSLTLGQDLGQHDTKSLIKCVETLSFIVRDAAHVTPDNFELCVRAIRVFVEASLNGGEMSKISKVAQKLRGGSRAPNQRPSRPHSDDEEDEGVPASYHTVALQLLDLMHTLHTRAASIYSSWAEEQRHLEAAGRKIEADSQTLWTSCWCPLLQGIAWLCCDARRQVRMQALTYLQRALLVHDLQTLDATEWESCFNKVLFPLLTKLLDNISPADVGGMEETRMRACTLLSKVFLQHLSPLLSLPTFAALWLTILDFMDKYMHAGSSDLLLEAIPESLKNMLLVMDTAGIFHSADSRTGYSDLWEITWERIVCFLPHLREELFKQTVIPGRPLSPQGSLPPAQPTSPFNPAETRHPSRPASPQEPKPAGVHGKTDGFQHSRSDCSSPMPPSIPSVPYTTSPLQAPSPLSQSPLILQPLASPLQVGVPPMSLPIILNPALIEATSPVPLLPGARSTSPSDEVK